MTREQALKYIWNNTHKDYKGKLNGVKTIMVYRNGSCLVAIEDLTNEEIKSRCPEFNG